MNESIQPKPKFNIGDEVFLLKENKIVQVKVHGIAEESQETTRTNENGFHIAVKTFKAYLYQTLPATFEDLKYHVTWTPEEFIFSSKEALIESLSQ